MGASTASALLRRRPDVVVILASRSRKSYDTAIQKRPELANAPVISLADWPRVWFRTGEPALPPYIPHVYVLCPLVTSLY